MDIDIHARIQRFLQQRKIVNLPFDGGAPDDMHKAGVVPFTRQEGYRFYLMKPVARHAGLAPPAFQLCKGTRMHYANGSWVDMKAPLIPSPPVGEGGAPAPGEGVSIYKKPPLPDPLPQGGRGLTMEMLAQTALREGTEELGLKLENIGQLLELGPYVFSSAKSGSKRNMWLFAAEAVSADDFLPDAEVAAATTARKWLSLAEFEIVGRDDHRYILRNIESRLRAHFKE